MRHIAILTLACLLGAGALASCSGKAPQESTRRERRLINAGNKEYEDGHYAEAMTKYREAMEESPNSAEARYNLGLTHLRRAETIEADSLKQAYMQSGVQHTTEAARRGSDRPMTASRASYNLGNVEFNQEQYAQAIEMYKQALRLNPDDEAARRNLRIAQLKKQQQDDQNKDNQDKDQDQQDQQQQDQQQQDQDKKDQKQDQNQQNQPQQQPQQPQEQQINPEASEQILKAMENKENATRARVMKGQNGREAAGAARHRKNW